MSEPLMRLPLSRLVTTNQHVEGNGLKGTVLGELSAALGEGLSIMYGMWVAWWKCILSVVTHAEHLEPLQLSDAL